MHSYIHAYPQFISLLYQLLTHAPLHPLLEDPKDSSSPLPHSLLILNLHFLLLLPPQVHAPLTHGPSREQGGSNISLQLFHNLLSHSLPSPVSAFSCKSLKKVFRSYASAICWALLVVVCTFVPLTFLNAIVVFISRAFNCSSKEDEGPSQSDQVDPPCRNHAPPSFLFFLYISLFSMTDG